MELLNGNLEIINEYDSPFLNKVGVYQDGTVPFCRDGKGKLWAISGHSHLGHIGMFCGDNLDNMVEKYPINTDFCVGSADCAFDKIKYPEGVKSRGSIWPFGLYICPKTDRFFVFFHNETGWNGKGTAYDALGYCEVPHFDSDFRHVGLMHSDDQGKNWTFDRWVLTSEAVCFSEKFIPDNVNAIGQSGDIIRLGSGDFSTYVEPFGDYIYLFYNIITVDIKQGVWKSCDTFVARTRKREDGIMGDFVKYYNGSFCEAGNFGKETPIINNSWHSRVAYLKKYGKYILTSAPINVDSSSNVIKDYMEIRTSNDLLNWSNPVTVLRDGKNFGNHYQAPISYHCSGNPFVIESDLFTVLNCHNGTDVKAFDFRIK